MAQLVQSPALIPSCLFALHKSSTRPRIILISGKSDDFHYHELIPTMAVPPFKVRALYDYLSQEEDDLKFKSNQSITVTDEEDADWYYGEYEDESGSKQEGLFPKNFVKVLEPEAPPRPSRAGRAKKEQESAAPRNELAKPHTAGAPLSAQEQSGTASQSESIPASAPEPAARVSSEQPREPTSTPASTMNTSKPVTLAEPKPTPPTTEKPSSNAFRDRINAFNKSTAPPVAPMKPGNLSANSGSGFIKKPFVAPPPSKNAYVAPPREPPPHKVYRREEDAGSYAQGGSFDDEDSKPAAPTAADTPDAEEDQPKPTSLKDRIALLQKQQMEQAARHAEAAQRKEKPQKSKRSEEPDDMIADNEEGDDAVQSAEADGKPSTEAARRHRQSKHETPRGSGEGGHYRDMLSDGNEADQSGAADTEEGEEASTGRDDSDGRPDQRPSVSGNSFSQRLREEPESQGEAALSPHPDEGGSEDEDVDPEVRRRMEIRERMAKMSGGMGMAGMFGPPGGLPSKAPIRKASSERKSSGHGAENSSSKAPPVPVIPSSGLAEKVQSPEQTAPGVDLANHRGEQPGGQGRAPSYTPDVEEDVVEQPPPSRRSTERIVPPTLSQGKLSASCQYNIINALKIGLFPLPLLVDESFHHHPRRSDQPLSLSHVSDPSTI